MKFNILKIFNSILFLILLFLNLYIYKDTEGIYIYKDYLTYNQLYQNREALSIKKLIFNQQDSLEVFFQNVSNKFSKWHVKLPDSSKYICYNNPKIKLIEGIQNYTILDDVSNDTVVSFKLNFVTGSSYTKSGRTRNSDVELRYCSIPFYGEQLFNISHWKQTSEYVTEKELEIAKKIVRDSIQIQTSDTDLSKIHKIGSFILRKLNSKRGIPKDTMDLVSPLKRFEFALSNKSKIWCGDFTTILSFFANVAGIPSRSVWVEGNANGIGMGGHSFNEVYINEFDKWIFVDLTSNTLGVQKGTGDYLNTIEFYNAFTIRSNEIRLVTYTNDDVLVNPIDYKHSFFNDYFNTNVDFRYYYSSQFSEKLYSFSEKIKRYFFPNPTYGIYSNSLIIDNSNFYLKQFAFVSLLLFSTYLFLLLGISKISRKK